MYNEANYLTGNISLFKQIRFLVWHELNQGPRNHKFRCWVEEFSNAWSYLQF